MGTLLASPVLAQQDNGPAIRSVIQEQVDAFLAEDTTTAFTYASPMIQGMFGTPENFGMMVRQVYPMIWAPSKVEFLGLRTDAGNLYQRVLFRDGSGALYLFDYEMQALPEGWKINGVFPVAPEAAGA